jgi:hypothetical protein
MPTLVWLYLTALRYYRTTGSCVPLAEALATGSHDRLTRLLPSDWSGRTRREFAPRTLFVWDRGYLILRAGDELTPLDGLDVLCSETSDCVHEVPRLTGRNRPAHSCGVAQAAKCWV